MILNKINYKNLILYGILNINNGYTIDQDNQSVNINVNISYNLSNIQETINSIILRIDELNSDEDITTEIRDHLKEDYDEQLEILNLIKEKLS